MTTLPHSRWQESALLLCLWPTRPTYRRDTILGVDHFREIAGRDPLTLLPPCDIATLPMRCQLYAADNCRFRLYGTIVHKAPGTQAKGRSWLRSEICASTAHRQESGAPTTGEAQQQTWHFARCSTCNTRLLAPVEVVQSLAKVPSSSEWPVGMDSQCSQPDCAPLERSSSMNGKR